MNDEPSAAALDARFSLSTLEFSEVLGLLRRYLSGPLSEPVLDSVLPSTDLNKIRTSLALVAEGMEALRAGPRPALGGLKDPRPVFDQLRIEGAACTGVEILVVLAMARAAREARQAFAKNSFDALAGLTARLADFRPVLAALEGKINPDGSLDSSASPELGRIRRAIESLRHDLRVELEKIVRRLGQEGILQDAVITLRNDRLVIPVRVEQKRRVPGVIHGASSSGATVYLEPLETVQLNNDLVELQDREAAETQRILGVFTEMLRSRRRELEEATEILSELDLAFAKAEFARGFGASLPEFAPARALVLRDARHPVLQETLARSDAKPVPLTIELEAPKTIMIISGPNTGGKTVALKTVGVSVLMAQSAVPVLATEARLPVFTRVLADIGDLQSIQANLSTFSAHITNIERMLQTAGADDLVLLDELGASTDPGEGAALAVALLDEFRQRRTMTLVTTHLARLKGYAAGVPEAESAAMEFNEATLQPSYRLIVGLPGKSSALEIAAHLGLRQPILARARELLEPGEEEASRLLTSLQERQIELDNRLAASERARIEFKERAAAQERKFEEERRRKLKELDKRFEEVLREVERRWKETVDELRAEAEARKAGKRVERRTAALREQARDEWNTQVLEALGAPAVEEPEGEKRPARVGDKVRLANFPAPATVTAVLDAEHLEVEAGRMRIRVRRDEVKTLPSATGSQQPSAPRGVRLEGQVGDAPAEVNLIGATAEEALARADEFLDRAYVAGRFRLRVIHGHGKGILRKALHEFFAFHPHVEKFYPAPPNEGGSGATIVELRV
jgi:DNA mismatch repair protein MutS2